MITVKKVYVGNELEAYIESNLTDGLNIIFSSDNHVGKTIVVQSLMYAMGSYPCFSRTFCYRDYYYIVELNVDGEELHVLRQKNSFVVLRDGEIIPFDNEAEFRRYWNDNVAQLPSIVKNGKDHLVYLALYNQMFFVPQSERSTAQIINPGQYNKADFIEMLYSIVNLDGRDISEEEEERLKTEKEDLEATKARLLKQLKLVNSSDPALAMVSPTIDKLHIEETVKGLDKAKEKVAQLRKERSRLYTKQRKYEIALMELRSLNRTISTSELVCMDCGSTRVGYSVSESEITFDVTTADMRTQILSSIKERIDSYADEISRLDADIRTAQQTFVNAMEEKNVSLSDVITYKDEWKNIAEIDNEILKIEQRLNEIKDILKASKQQTGDMRKKQKDFKEGILSSMNVAHDQLCLGETHSEYGDIFTTSATAYTGSEATEFFLSRVYALATQIGHGYPIVVDSFRAEDLSTARESKALNLLKALPNQIILTTTIKNEEHDKYQSEPSVNSIDYSNHVTNKLLSPEYVEELVQKLQSFGIITKGA